MKYLEIYNKNKQGLRRNFIKNFFLDRLDKKYKLLGHNNLNALYFERVFKMMNTNDENLTLVEIGGGDGYFLSSNHPNIKRKIMIDIDDFYKEKFMKDNIEFYCHDVSKEKLIYLENEEVNIVVLNHVIEHINDLDFFINEIKRVLKPKGFLYIRTPDIKKVGFKFYDDYTHIRPFTFSSLEHCMNVYGFKTFSILFSNMDTIKLEDIFYLPSGKLSFLNAKEIEALFQKIN